MKLRHLRYHLLSHITFGKMKQHYKRKWKAVKRIPELTNLFI